MTSSLDKGEMWSKEANPCLKEANESSMCMESHGYIRKIYQTECRLVFENYKACKKFWFGVKEKRKLLDRTPAMPTEKDQEDIKELLGDNLPYIPMS